MLRYFRINDPYRLIILLVLLLLASLPFLLDLPPVTLQELKDMVLGEVIGDKTMYTEIVDRTAPMMAVTDGVLNFVFGRSLLGRHLLALFIIFFQASYFGILLINNKAYNENTYVPALVFGFMCFFSFDMLATTPELLASTLLLLTLNNLFKEIEFRVDRDSIVLNLGVFLGFSSLYVLSYSIFLIGAIIILIVFARATFRKIAMLVFGYGLVHASLFILYYCFGRTGDLWAHFYVASVTQMGLSLVGINSLLVLLAIPVLYLVFSLFMLTREARFTKYQSQVFQTIFLWLAIACIHVWLAPNRTPHSFFPCIAPVAYFIGHYLLLIRRKMIAEAMLWLFVAGLLSVSLLSRYQMLKQVDYVNLFPKGSVYESLVVNRKVAIIGDDPSLYLKNNLAGYFFDWSLSKRYFEQPDYYENLIKINQSFLLDPPEVIIDESGLMEPIMERIPSLKLGYRKEGAVYWKR